MTGEFKVRPFMSGYAVFDGTGKRRSGLVNHINATMQAERMYAESLIKDRKCLRCGTMFPSEGVHNRICNPCKNRIAIQGYGDIEDYSMGRAL